MTVSVDNAGLAWLGAGWTPVVLTRMLLVIMHLLLSKTRFGQYTYSIGGNPQSAVRAGINRHRVRP